MIPTALSLLLGLSPTSLDNPIELGRVRFLRSVDEGLVRAERETKPVLLLFQEVPG